MRVKKGHIKQQRHKAVKSQTKGMQSRRRKSFRMANQAVIRSLQYAHRDRRNRKRDFRTLWIQRINAAVRPHGLSYSRFMKLLKDNNITLNRKVLSEIAIENPAAFEQIVKTTK